MKKLLLAVGLLWSALANAQFVPGQLLTAAELNTQFALYAPLAGATFTGTVSAPTGSFANLSASANVSGLGFQNLFASPPPIGNVTPAFGSFTTLGASGTVSGVGFTNLFASPPSIGNAAAGTGAFTALSATSSFTATGLVTLVDLATQTANTVLANATAGTASPTAFAMPSCSTSSSALNWATSTGFTCNTAINASTLGGTAAASYALLASPTFTGAPAAPTAAAHTNTTQIATTAFVETEFASPPAIGNVTANTGRFTSATITTGGVGITGGLTMSTGAITPVSTAGITGTTTNDNAVAGADGEYLTATTSGTSLTTATPTNCTSESLTAGDWDVTGTITFTAAGGAVDTQRAAGISTTSATFPATSTGGFTLGNYSSAATTSEAFQSPLVRTSLASTTTVYLIGQATFSSGTMTCNGFIRARRVR